MSLTGFLFNKQNAIVFCDNTEYAVKRIPSLWLTYENFKKDVIHAKSSFKPKFAIATNTTIFETVGTLTYEAIKKSVHFNTEDTPYKVAEKISVYAQKEPKYDYYPFRAWIIGYNKQKNQIEIYQVNEPKFEIEKPKHLRNCFNNPNLKFHVGSASIEPEIIIDNFIMRYPSIDKFVELGFEVFDYITQNFPLYMKPWFMAIIGKNGIKILNSEKQSKTQKLKIELIKHETPNKNAPCFSVMLEETGKCEYIQTNRI